MKRYAIIGFGCAGYSAAKSLREMVPDCRIDVYSDTDKAPENPMLTTYYAAGRIPRENLYPFGKKEDIIHGLGIRFFADSHVERVSAPERSVTADGITRKYDDIVLASGAKAFVPPIKGLPEKGVYVMRTAEDADQLIKAVGKGASTALVIGASWVGIKVVEALKAHGVSSILADMAPYIFPTACLPHTAANIQERLQRMGVLLKFGSGIASMEETERGILSRFDDDTAVTTDLVALCMGVRPSIPYVDREEIEVGRGIRVDSHMETSSPHIYAAGDCCETMEIMSGTYMPVNLWANAFVQGRTAGRNIAGCQEEFPGALAHNIAHFLDMDFVGIGSPRASGKLVESGSPEAGNYVCALVEDGTINCVNILGNYRLGGLFKQWFVWQRQQEGRKIPAWLEAGLLREGVNREFIHMMGGDGA